MYNPKELLALHMRKGLGSYNCVVYININYVILKILNSKTIKPKRHINYKKFWQNHPLYFKTYFMRNVIIVAKSWYLT